MFHGVNIWVNQILEKKTTHQVKSAGNATLFYHKYS